MASIQTGIQLNDGFTSVLNSMIGSVSLAISAMEDMWGAMNTDIDTGSLEGARIEIERATMAVNELERAVSGVGAPAAAGPDMGPGSSPEPVNVPVQWQTEGLDVFTGSGAERFRQEVQSTDAMLQQLCSTQDAIAKQAYDTVIFPPEAFRNLNSMAVRIDSIRDRIQQIESSPMNIGVDAVNSELEQLRTQLSQAVSIQNELKAAVDGMDVSTANDAYLRLNRTVSGTERYLRDNVDEQGRFNREIDRSVSSTGNLRSMIASAVGNIDGLACIRKAISWIKECTEAFDTQRNAELRLMAALANTVEAEVEVDASEAVAKINDIRNQADGVALEVSPEASALQGAFDAITAKASEIQSKGIYSDEAMIAGAAEFSMYFSDTEAIGMMMDTLTDYAMGMSGGGALDAKAMVDYATGLGKIMSGSYDAMTEKGFAFTEAQKAVIEGTASQEQIISAIGEEYLDASADIQAAAAINAVIAKSWDGLYESMSNTPEGKIIQMTNAWEGLKEVAGSQLYPYVILFVDVITSNWGTIQGVVDGITLGLQVMMGVLSWLLEGVFGFAQVVMDNWSCLEPIIYGIAVALALFAAYQGITAAATAVAAAGQWLWNNAMLASPLTWIILLIIALIAVIFMVCNIIAETTGVANSGFGVIIGGINVVIQFFKNLGLTVANIALGIGSAIGALAGNMMTAFHNAICSVQSWFYNLLSTGLTVIEKICAALNKLPFVDIDYSGISNAADDYAAKAAEAAGNKEEYKSISDAFSEGFSTFDTFQSGWASDAFAAGAAWGDGIADKIDNFSLAELFSADDIPSPDDYIKEFGGGMDDISDDTGAIRDALDITQEDLKYLRDIAEQEAVNRFTLAEVKVEQTNHNNISSSMDLDGVVSGLTDAVSEAVDSITEGVHE